MNSPSGDQWSLSCSYIPLGLAWRTQLLPPPPAIWQELKRRQNINDTQKRCRKITPSSQWISLPPKGPLRSGPFLKSLLRSVTFSGLPIHFHILSLCEPQSLFPLLSRQTGCCLPMVSLLPLSFFFCFISSDPLVIHSRGCQPCSGSRMQPVQFTCHCLSAWHWPAEPVDEAAALVTHIQPE